jgi:hypothetical protein
VAVNGGGKSRRCTSSIEHYVIVDWEERQLIHRWRSGAGLAPILKAGTLKLDPFGIEIEVEAIFNG